MKMPTLLRHTENQNTSKPQAQDLPVNGRTTRNPKAGGH